MTYIDTNSDREAILPVNVYTALCIHRPPANTNLGESFSIFGIAKGSGVDKGKAIISKYTNVNSDYNVSVTSDNRLRVYNLNIYAPLYYLKL